MVDGQTRLPEYSQLLYTGAGAQRGADYADYTLATITRVIRLRPNKPMNEFKSNQLLWDTKKPCVCQKMTNIRYGS